MPFKGSRGPLIIGVIVIAVILLALIVASQGPPANKKIKESETISFTIEKNIGIDRVIYTNHNNPGEVITLTYVDLPYSGNCSRGDAIQFETFPRDGYQWNTYKFAPMGRTNSDNYLLIIAGDEYYTYNNQIKVTPATVYLKISPTVTPTPFISPSPTPIE